LSRWRPEKISASGRGLKRHPPPTSSRRTGHRLESYEYAPLIRRKIGHHSFGANSPLNQRRTSSTFSGL
jgi:hypothetical protein